MDPMEEESPSPSKDSQESTKEGSTQESQQNQASLTDKEINVEEADAPLPPSFHHTLTEETLCNDDRTYVFRATIRIPISENPDDPVSMMFEHLKTFTTHMLEADAHFTVFPYNLSKYEWLEDLPELLEDTDHIP